MFAFKGNHNLVSCLLIASALFLSFHSCLDSSIGASANVNFPRGRSNLLRFSQASAAGYVDALLHRKQDEKKETSHARAKSARE